VGRYGVVAGSVDDDILTLSGGNQQKVLLARWLTTGPRLILLDDPSVGVDVGARAALHGVIRAAASDGAAVLCSSSDPYELVELCRRVLVLRDGRMADELSGERLTTHVLGHAIHGSAEGD
jgi:ribose transport system ATP-binding protein